jgi:hypothetical protein
MFAMLCLFVIHGLDLSELNLQQLSTSNWSQFSGNTIRLNVVSKKLCVLYNTPSSYILPPCLT